MQRRRFLTASATVTTALLAGCNIPGGEGDDEDDDENEAGDDEGEENGEDGGDEDDRLPAP